MMLQIIENKSLTARGMFGIYPANSVGDDIEVYSQADRSEVKAKFYGLRQQQEKDSENEEPYYCLSDFVAPLETGKTDFSKFLKFSFNISSWIFCC